MSSRRSRTPPPARRRSPIAGRRVRSRSRSPPPRYGRTGSAAQSRDAREIIRREREKRSGHSDPFLRERERQVIIYCISVVNVDFILRPEAPAQRSGTVGGIPKAYNNINLYF